METLRCMAYSFRLIYHPFDGFWDLKHEKRGSVKAANIILVILIFTLIMKRQLTGFIFNIYDPTKLNVFAEIFGVIAPFALWCIANWCLTTLMDGEGSFKDIWIASAYAMVPLILINIPLTIFSNFMTPEGMAFYHFFDKLAVVWMVMLIFFGNMTTHQYSISKTFFTCIFTIVGMGIIIFISLLFFYLIQQMMGFIVNLYREIAFRL
jgi:hypothetical protein